MKNAPTPIIEEPTHYDVICKAYNDITAEIKGLLKHYPIEYRRYIEVDESNENVPHHDSFYSPLVYITIFDGYGEFYINFSRNFTADGLLSFKNANALSRCIYKHTSTCKTVLDIEDHVTEVNFHKSFKGALKKYQDGDERYKPILINSIKDEA